MKKQIKRIIISNTGKIRDTILSIPSFFMAKKMYPDAEIIVLANKSNYEIARNLPYINRVLIIDDYKKSEIEDKIAYFNADVFIALYTDSFVKKLAKASKAKIKIGPITSISSFFTYRHGVFQKRENALKNEAEYNLDLIKKLNKKLFKDNYELNTKLYLSNSSKIAADTFFKESKIIGNTLIVNPFTGGSNKNLTDEQYITLLKKFKKKNRDVKIIILCDINQEERAYKFIEEIKQDGVYIFPNGGDLLNIAAIINMGDLYLGPITGPTQMAGALKKDVIAIYPEKLSCSKVRWGLLNNDKVVYIIPDENNRNENYKKKNFNSYDEETENIILTELGKHFRFNV
ncbi:MAG: lipopolysaccharide heptosyltransferase family protein [Fusobacteriaceae bacterium]|jgi:ADP-heptose:LPS heptosyltransferase|nr:lipopolysaccharide heptosyltransferase family protein [Fusobacteriaceae bacterium]